MFSGRGSLQFISNSSHEQYHSSDVGLFRDRNSVSKNKNIDARALAYSCREKTAAANQNLEHSAVAPFFFFFFFFFCLFCKFILLKSPFDASGNNFTFIFFPLCYTVGARFLSFYMLVGCYLYSQTFFFPFFLFTAAPVAYGSSQARG